MNSQQENTKRIAKNTLMLYVRMLFSMLVSLYTSRVVLQTLGVEDYGIYNVVGGVVAMFSMISSSLSSSVSRFLTFELGRGNIKKLRQIFSISVFIHLALCIIVLFISETLGVWFLNTQLTIPQERLYAANWVFQASTLSFIMGLISVPYNASIVSHERMDVYAYMGILDVLLRLLVILFVAYFPFVGDKLIVYSLLLVCIAISMRFFYVWFCRRHFEECRMKLVFKRNIFNEMGTFAVWNFIGCVAALLRDHGVNILLNIFIGPVINAARGIAVSVNTVISGFAGNFMIALNPQVTKSYASGEYAYMNGLVERGPRFSFYIMLFLVLPIMLETEFILAIWLKEYPQYTIIFVRLVLVTSMIEILSSTLIALQNATGNIRNYQLAVGGMLMMNFPLSYICLKLGFSPVSVYVVLIVVAVLCLVLRLLFLRKMVAAFSAMSFVKNVCMNVVVVSVASSLLPMLFHAILPYGWLRLIVVTIISMVSAALGISFIGCNKSERQFIYSKAGTIISKFRK